MPYKKIDEVPSNIAKHKGVELTLSQANKWNEIYDALKSNDKVKNPAATAWSTFEEVFEVQGDKWGLRKRDAAESIALSQEISCIETTEFENGSDGLPKKARIVLILAGKCK